MGNRPELTSYAYRKTRARILTESDICIVCGHTGSQAVDHVIPAARGGSPTDPDNLAPIHGVQGCPTCGRKCNNDKSDKALPQVTSLHTSRDWYS